MIERSHLRIIEALADNGSLTAAANALHLTQPALSHQIRYLEQKLELQLWQREGRKLRLTNGGKLLLQIARQVLPVLEQGEQTLRAYASGKQGILRLGVECHPCYQWLKGLLADYLQQLPAMDVDIVHQFQFSGIEGLVNHHIDVLVTPDKLHHTGVHFEPVFDYELVLLLPENHSLAGRAFVEAECLQNELLLTFPVNHERLDVFSQFLWPANIQPETKAMQSLDIMVQMVLLGRGVTVLPDWLATELSRQSKLTWVRLGSSGVPKTLFAAIREDEVAIPYMQTFVELAKQHRKV